MPRRPFLTRKSRPTATAARKARRLLAKGARMPIPAFWSISARKLVNILLTVEAGTPIHSTSLDRNLDAFSFKIPRTAKKYPAAISKRSVRTICTAFPMRFPRFVVLSPQYSIGGAEFTVFLQIYAGEFAENCKKRQTFPLILLPAAAQAIHRAHPRRFFYEATSCTLSNRKLPPQLARSLLSAYKHPRRAVCAPPMRQCRQQAGKYVREL